MLQDASTIVPIVTVGVQVLTVAVRYQLHLLGPAAACRISQSNETERAVACLRLLREEPGFDPFTVRRIPLN